jgi:hypothetical protein
MKHRFAVALYVVLALALALFAGTALAGSHDKGGHAQKQAQQRKDQQKQQEHRQAQQQKAQSTTSCGDNSKGVKPSSTTQHDTHAPACSDQTKQYGNGQTAGQIATQSGHGGDTLHGPGNSQPHKVNCGGHEVDVHALKHKGSKCEAQQGEQKHAKHQKVEHAKAPLVTFCDMESATSGKLETKPADKVIEHELNGTPEEARDIVPTFTVNGQSYSQIWTTENQAIYNNSCTAPVSGTQPSSSSTQSSTSDTSNATQSAQATQSSVSATQQSAIQSSAPATSSAAPSSAAPSSAAPSSAAPSSAPTSSGSVLGAVSPVKTTTAKAKPTSGVLGATARIGRSVGARNLPFTGLKLWIFALLALALIAVGALARRASAHR